MGVVVSEIEAKYISLMGLLAPTHHTPANKSIKAGSNHHNFFSSKAHFLPSTPPLNLLKMFSKVALFVAATMAVFVTAAPSGAGSCNTGPIQCCDEMHHKDSRPAALLLSKVGVNVQDVTGDVGATCSPITAVGLGSGASWSVFIS